MASRILWRYRPYLPEREHELVEIVAEGRIWCPAAKHFNDPFDLNPVFTHSHIPISEQVRRVQRMAGQFEADRAGLDDVMRKARAGFMNSSEYRQQIVEALREDLRTMPILCFYPHWGSVPMWAHYATTASGFAVGLEISDPWDNMFYPLPCKYSTERPIVNLSEDLLEDKEARQRHLEHVFLTKSDVWKQEEEERMIFDDCAEGHYNLPPGVVKEICFGFNAPDHLIETALTIAGERDRELIVSQIRISNQTYSLERDVLSTPK